MLFNCIYKYVDILFFVVFFFSIQQGELANMKQCMKHAKCDSMYDLSAKCRKCVKKYTKAQDVSTFSKVIFYLSHADNKNIN